MTARSDNNNNKKSKKHLRDVYGQIHPDETKELVKSSLREFDLELESIPNDEKKYVCEAENKCPNLLTDDFKLMFLRCEVYNVDLAVKRYINYWKKRVEVFGPEKAFQPLTQDAALRDDSDAMRNGFLRLTGTKGLGGRNIVFIDPSLQDLSLTTESVMRAFWYLFHIALEDEDSQKKGFIFLVDIQNCTPFVIDKKFRKNWERMVASSQSCLPIRVSGLHFFNAPFFVGPLLSFAGYLVGKRLRQRIKVHSGSEEDIQADLKKYCLSSKVMPVDVGGGTVELHQERWLDELRRRGK